MQNYIRSFESHFRRGNQKNPHARRVGKNFRAIEDGIMKGNGEDPKTESDSTLQQLMGGIIERVLRIVEGVEVEIKFDPFLHR